MKLWKFNIEYNIQYMKHIQVIIRILGMLPILNEKYFNNFSLNAKRGV